MRQRRQYAVVAIPLRHPDIVHFLLPPSPQPRGAPLPIIGQRPTAEAQFQWATQLQQLPQPTITDVLRIDDPHGHLVAVPTDRLVPLEFLHDPDYLTRNLGGWAALYFGVVELLPDQADDPLVRNAEVLVDYGEQIRFFGADPALVEARLEQEIGGDLASLVAAITRLHALRTRMAAQRTAYIEHLYAEIQSGRFGATASEPPLPDLLLFDELMGQLVALEQERRDAIARSDQPAADAIKQWQRTHTDQTGLRLILKGEYIMGRHRRSTVLIAPELNAVIKQPAPEPFHEAVLGARTFADKAENWPTLTQDGALVTPRGRLRLVIEEELVPRLHDLFKHPARFSTLMGLIVEPYVNGRTVQELVLSDHSRLDAELYEVFLLHQQVCELLGIENGDWHAANFMVRNHDNSIVHVDWGAARPLRAEEQTPPGEQERRDQVQNIAFSFHHPDLAQRVVQLHAAYVADADRMAHVRQRAQAVLA